MNPRSREEAFYIFVKLLKRDIDATTGETITELDEGARVMRLDREKKRVQRFAELACALQEHFDRAFTKRNNEEHTDAGC